MVPSDWDLAPKCVCGPNLISYLVGESPILSPAASIGQRLLIVQTTRGDSLWVKGISEPRVRDTVFRFVITVVS